MKPIYNYSLILLFVTASLSYADKKNPRDNIAALEKTTTDTTDQIKKEEVLTKKLKKVDPVEQLVNYLDCTGMNKKQRIAAVRLFKRGIIRRHNKWQLKQFLNAITEPAEKLSVFFSALASSLPKITSNELLVERVANGESTQKDLEFVEKAFATYEDFGIVERIDIAKFFQDFRDK